MVKSSGRNLLVTVILFPPLPPPLKLNDFGVVLVKVGKALPVNVPVQPFPLRSVTLVPVPEYDEVDSGLKCSASVLEIIDAGAEPIE